MAQLRERQQVMELRLVAAGRGRDARADRPAAQLPARGAVRRPGRPRARAVRRQSLLRLRDGPRVVREGRDHAQRRAAGCWRPRRPTPRTCPRRCARRCGCGCRACRRRSQQVLGAAAVIGAVVDIDLLREVLPDLTEADVLDAIDALLPRRVFRETGNAGRVEFVHDLLRELPYGDLSATRRRSLHRRVGELLERRASRARPSPPPCWPTTSGMPRTGPRPSPTRWRRPRRRSTPMPSTTRSPT